MRCLDAFSRIVTVRSRHRCPPADARSDVPAAVAPPTGRLAAPPGKRSTGKVRLGWQQCTAGPRAPRGRARHRRGIAHRAGGGRGLRTRPAPRRISARRLPDPPGRRAPLWFAALVAGALLAAAPSVIGGPAGPEAQALDYGLGAASDLTLSGEIDDAGVRRSITEAEAQARLGELAASRAARAPKTFLPTQGRLTTCYCMRWGQMHYGLDLAAPLGTPIVSAADGVVLRAGPGLGLRQRPLHPGRGRQRPHLRAHALLRRSRPGTVVHAGDQIAKVGNQGQSTGPHLHYEIHRGGSTDVRWTPRTGSPSAVWRYNTRRPPADTAANCRSPVQLSPPCPSSGSLRPPLVGDPVAGSAPRRGTLRAPLLRTPWLTSSRRR